MRNEFEQILRAIELRRDEMVSDLSEHVAICTGTGHAPGLDQYRAMVVARLEALGARSTLVQGQAAPDWIGSGPVEAEPPPTVVCAHDEPAKPAVLLAGHLDTVFGPDHPFCEMSIGSDGTTAHGPGVADMKGGVLAAIVGLEALAEIGHDVPWTFLLNSDEETGSYASDRALRHEASRHRWGLALEPALPDGSLAIERKGSGQFLIEVLGRAAHAGREFEKGVSAVYGLAHVLERVKALTDLERGITVNIGPLQGGRATNIVPDAARAWGNARFRTREDGQRLIDALEALATSDGAMPRVVVRHSFMRPAKPLIPDVQLLANLAREVSEGLGRSLPFASTGGVCDGNILQDAGLPTIDTLGVRGGGLHTTSEWIEIDSLIERAALIACLLVRLGEES